ncbi:FliH/SctL family protein [Pseudooceanicola sp. C21-150M6]|uniref:FliH/SctL family protein n=1 Tax=Pseudooceanicola sp. C21-150M6 TaxID=3434355 RepID=UPI003D7FA8A4
MSFVFDRNFDEEAEIEARNLLRARRAIHTPEDLEEAVRKARKEAYEDGRLAGRAEASVEHGETTAARQADALVALGPSIKELLGQADQHRVSLEAQVLDYILTVFKQVAPELLERTATLRVEEEVRNTLRMAVGAASLQIHLPADLASDMSVQIGDIARQSGFHGRVHILPDSSLRPGDCQVEWDHGSMEYSLSSICDGIIDALNKATIEAMAKKSKRAE